MAMEPSGGSGPSCHPRSLTPAGCPRCWPEPPPAPRASPSPGPGRPFPPLPAIPVALKSSFLRSFEPRRHSPETPPRPAGARCPAVPWTDGRTDGRMGTAPGSASAAAAPGSPRSLLGAGVHPPKPPSPAGRRAGPCYFDNNPLSGFIAPPRPPTRGILPRGGRGQVLPR